jgi:hypothetical protein
MISPLGELGLSLKISNFKFKQRFKLKIQNQISKTASERSQTYQKKPKNA